MACLQALPDAGFYSSFLCYLWTTQSHLHRKLTSCWSLNQLSTYQLARFSTWDWIGFHTYFFSFREGDLLRPWPEIILFCEDFPNQDRVWRAELALEGAEERCPVGSCHTSLPHTPLSWGHVRQHHHTLPVLVFSIKKKYPGVSMQIGYTE